MPSQRQDESTLETTARLVKYLAVVAAIAGIVNLAGLSYENTCVFAALLLLCVAWFWDANYDDPYGTFHIALNMTNEAQRETGPPTEWLNMGFWKA